MYRKITIIAAFIFAVTGYCMGQEVHQPSALDTETLKQANNPLAKVKAFNIHNYYVSSIYGVTDMTANQTMFRYAQPLGPFIVRATLPIALQSMPGMSPTSGLGDFSMFAIYKFKSGKPGTEIGIGPQIVIPTATNDLGQGKWQAGLSALAYFAGNPHFQAGTLLQWQASFAGDDNRADVNMITTQLFGMWQLGGGTYLRSTGIWSFDLEGGAYNIPIGLGIGKVLKAGKTVFNIFAEPQYSVFAYGVGQTKTQLFIGFNTQF